jgi:hypothetical protein
MKGNKIRAQRDYKCPAHRYHKLAKTVPNRLQQQYATGQPDVARATDITYIRTYVGVRIH